MKDLPTLSRRRLLTLASTAALTAVAGTLAARSWLAARSTNGDRIAETIEPFDAQSIAGLGAAYLVVRPQEADVGRLKRSLGFGQTDITALMAASAAPLRRQLEQRHRDDFLEDRTVKIDGWVLSETELRLAALAHLTR